MPTVLVFGETRLQKDHRGYRTHDSGVAGRAWTRGLDGVPGLGLAMRVEAVDGEVEGSHAVEVADVAELPPYVGFHGLARSAPALVREVDAAVRRCDVVVARLPGLMGLLAIGAALRHHKPVAVEMVGDVRDVLDAGTIGGAGRMVALPVQVLTALAMRQAQAARYMTRTALQRRYPVREGVPTVGFSSVRLDDDWVIEESAPAGLPDGPPRLLAIGSQEQLYKGHDTLIRALPRVLAHYPDARLQLVGQGRMQGTLQDLACDLGVAEHVDFLGYISDRDRIRALLDGASIFCMPSRTEGLPRALVEAMARGRVALGSPVGGIPELIEAEFLVGPDDADEWARRINSLLSSPAECERTGRRNAREASSYSRSALAPLISQWRSMVTNLTEATG